MDTAARLPSNWIHWNKKWLQNRNCFRLNSKLNFAIISLPLRRAVCCGRMGNHTAASRWIHSSRFVPHGFIIFILSALAVLTATLQYRCHDNLSFRSCYLHECKCKSEKGTKLNIYYYYYSWWDRARKKSSRKNEMVYFAGCSGRLKRSKKRLIRFELVVGFVARCAFVQRQIKIEI